MVLISGFVAIWQICFKFSSDLVSIYKPHVIEVATWRALFYLLQIF